MVVFLLRNRHFSDVEKWERTVGVFLDPWLRLSPSLSGGDEEALNSGQFAEKTRLHFWDEEKVCDLFCLVLLRLLLSLNNARVSFHLGPNEC